MKLICFIALVLISQTYGVVFHPHIVRTGQNITEGIYTFTDAASGHALEIEKESVAEKAQIVFAKASTSNSQKFLVKKIFEGYFVIANVKSGLYLSFNDDHIAQLPLTYTSEQQWVVRERSAGEYYLEPNLMINRTVNPATEEGKRIPLIHESKAKSGFKATPTTVNAADAHKLDKATIEALTHKSDKKIAAGTYTIAVVSTGHALDIAKEGKQIIAAAAANTPTQHFKVEVNADGLARIVNVKLGEAVVTTGNQMDGGSEIDHVAIAEKDLKQWWRITERGTDVWSIINEHSKESLTVPAGEHAVQQYFIGTVQQLFTFKAI